MDLDELPLHRAEVGGPIIPMSWTRSEVEIFDRVADELHLDNDAEVAVGPGARSKSAERVKGRERGPSCACHVQLGNEREGRGLELLLAQVGVLADAREEPLPESR